MKNFIDYLVSLSQDNKIKIENTHMKIINKLTLFGLVLILLPIHCSYAQQDSFFVGEISAKHILTQFEDFAQHSNDVDYQQYDLTRLKSIEDNIVIKVFFGQWCHDSVREVPRVIKLLEQVNNPNITSWFYGLNTKKSDPLLLSKTHNIKKTPTVIIYKNDKEIGRILEVPQVNWLADIEALLLKI